MPYIDKEMLEDRMYHEAFEKDSDMQEWDNGCWIRYKLFENVLRDIPTADVVERKKGKWMFWEKNRVMCPFCKLEPYVKKGAADFNYCPYCGADMRGEDTI